jgi:DNA-binding transcriptional LysR family regulator
MDIRQLKTFVAVAREGSIARASEQLHLSQPAVSAHIKAIEDALGLALFARTTRGMSLTADGKRLLEKAELTLGAHPKLMDEATRIEGPLTGKLRLGAGSNSNHAAIGKLLARLSERHPELEVVLKHASSAEVLAELRSGTLDVGFYNEAGEVEPELTALEVASFGVHVVAAPGLVAPSARPDWKALAELPWIYPAASTCCGGTAERLFKAQHMRPKRIVSVDRQEVARTLIAAAIGVGLLHDDAAREAQQRGEVERIHEPDTRVRVLLAHLTSRAQDPRVMAACAIMKPQG